MGPCSSKTGLFIPPSVHVSKVDYRGFSPVRGISCDIYFDIDNPNPATLQSNDLTLTMTKRSDGTVLTRGEHGLSFQAAGMTTTTIPVPVTFSYGGMGAAGKSLVLHGSTTIVVTGEVIFDAPLTPKGVVKISFHNEATIVVS